MNRFCETELANLVLGQQIGFGSARKVYVCRFDKRFVVKVEKGGTHFQNVVEWEIWKTVKDSPLARWFAPCPHISGAGAVLIQRRTDTVSEEHYPKRLPAFLGDLKRENFGMMDGRVVCHDYGNMWNFAAAVKENTGSKLVNVEWWRATW